MTKNKPVSTWPLSILVIVVSFLSILVVYQQVSAVWLEPVYQPNDTNLLNNFVFTPMAQDLDLGSHTISATNGAVSLDDDVDVSGDLNVDGSLTVGGVPVVGGSPTTNYWEAVGTDGDIANNNTRNVLINNQLCFGADCRNSWPAAASTYWLQTGNDIYYNTGKVGIGTASPNRNLHIYDTVQNAELDIQSVSGAGNHWAVYHDSASNDLKFWKGGADRVTLADTGEVGVNIAPNNSYQFYVSASANKSASYFVANNTAGLYGVRSSGGQYGVYSEVGGITGIPTYGLYAKSTAASPNFGIGVYGEGFIGVAAVGRGSNSVGLQSIASVDSGSRAANFYGDVFIAPMVPNTTGFLQIAAGLSTSGTCSAAYVGRMFLDSTNNRLYVCSGSTPTWKYATLQ